MDVADTQQLAKQYKEAAATYAQVLAENLAPDRAEEATQRRVTALHLAGQYKESDDLAARFEQTYPRSTLLADVLFRTAENAYQVALAAAKDAGTKENKAELDRLFGAALARYGKLVEKYPEFEYVDFARHAMATAHARTGRYPEAIALLQAIPEANRNGELATVPYLMADCLIRTFPPETDDALRANRLINAAEEAARLLESFAAAQPKGPHTPDALLKLGHCYGRIGVLLADPAERQKTLAKAKEAYDKCQQQFPNDPAVATVAFERARALAAAGDAGSAMNDLRRYQSSDPYRSSPNAPLALLRLSTLLRAQGNAAEAVSVMNKCRSDHEAALAKDPARADWVAMIRYEQAVAVKENRKLPEARAMFEAVAKEFAGRPEATNATWRAVQCRREELAEQVAAARKATAKPTAKPEEVAAAYAPLAEPLKALAASGEALRAQADELGRKLGGSEPHQWMLYELAWCNRLLADVETDTVRQKLRQAALDAVRARLVKEAGTQNVPTLTAPDVPASAVPVQPGEQRAQDCYRMLIAAAPASALSTQARLELAELVSQRGDHDAALDLLAAALENNPPAELADRIKLRAAACFLARDDGTNALAQARPVLQNAKSPVAAEARYLAGEALIRQKDWAKAVETLTPFRDQDPYRGLPDLADRALLRLGYALAESGQWEPSRSACETLIQRFPRSQWADEAWYAMGWALQNQKRYDEAVTAYTDVTRRTAAEVAAKAQYNVGVCRSEQKRHPDALKALLAAAYTYDYPDWSAAAWYQAGLVHAEMKQPDEAAKAWRRVVKEHPTSRWALLAQQKLQ
jgi:tetratricopeptide (TPR) repeat protein